MKDKQLIDFSGKMNLDADPSKLNPKDYSDAKNIQFLTDGTESTGSHIPMLGNVPAFDLGSVPVQNKIWRLNTVQQVAPAQSIILKAIDQNGNVFSTLNVLRTNPVSGGGVTQTSVINTWINTFYGAATAVGTGTTSGHIDITLSGISGYDIIFTVTTSSSIAGVPDAALEIRQEAYDASLAGELHDIEGNDLLSDLYIFSTPQTHLPETVNLTVVAITDFNLTSRFQVQFASAHNLVNGQKISLSKSGTAIDGIWIVAVINATTIKLEEYHNVYVPIATPFTVTLTKYLEGVGEIGVGQYNINADTWSYTRLLRTKEWNFRTKKQIDGRPSTRTEDKDSVYLTDNYNVPRCFYYTKPFIQDGALSFNGGRYSYGSIAKETTNVISSSGARINFISQTQGGGQVPAGNWRYSGRFLTDTLSSTEPLAVSNPINVFSASTTGSPYLITGDDPQTITSKINNLKVTGIIPGLFKYFELLGINYVGGAIQGYVIKRILLDTVSDTLLVSHLGTETDISNLDLGLLSQVFLSVETAKSNEIIDNRLIYSNIKQFDQADLSAWAQTFKHTLFKKSINSVKNNLLSLQLGEYQDPNNVFNFAGYMQNETYRFGVKVRFTNSGEWSDAFHIDDVIFNTEPTNSASTDPTRRVSGLPDFDLTDFTGAATPNFSTTTVYVPAIDFNNIDFDFLVGGVPVKKLVDQIQFVRAEVNNPTILACGYCVPSIKAGYVDNTVGVEYGFTYTDTVTYNPIIIMAPGTGIGEYPFISGRAGGTNNNPLYTDAEFNALGRDKRVMAFYSPDIMFNHTSLSFLTGDVLLNHGNPVHPDFTWHQSNPANIGGQYGQWNGFFNTSGTTPNVIKTNTISQVITINSDTDVALTSGKTYRKRMALFNAQVAVGTYSVNHIISSPVIECTNDLDVFGSQSNYGFCYVQYYRAIVNPYGDTATTRYVTCGSFFDVDESITGLQSIDVFGGDTFTQLSYLRTRTFTTAGETFPGFPAPSADTPGFGGGVSFYSQNRVNAQMKFPPSTSSGDYPKISTDTWLDRTGEDNSDYNSGYTIRNQVQSSIAFNVNQRPQTNLPNWIIWSNINLGNGGIDGYRTFLPANFHVLNGTYGAILNHANAGGELITWQDRAFMRQYFNTRGTLEVKNITQILIGDGSVMSRDGVTLSRFGSLNKWGIVQGVSSNGDDVYAWINTELNNVCHYASNGTLTISDDGVKSFFANNLKWVKGKDTPADLEGIHGIYDQRFNNFIFTVKGQINKAQSFGDWNNAVGYTTGDKVWDADPNYPFSTFGFVYESIDPNINSGNKPYLFPLQWKRLPNNGTYYNEYAIVFNGYKSGFICFNTPLPKIYNKWQNTFLSPRPLSPEYKLYQHNKGIECVWYDFNNVNQSEKAYIEGVVNKHPELTKWFTALAIDSDVQPDSTNFSTKNQISFLTTGEFDKYEDSYFSPIKEDSTFTGVNDANTSLLWGKWLKVKFNFATGIYQKLSNIIVNFEISKILK